WCPKLMRDIGKEAALHIIQFFKLRCFPFFHHHLLLHNNAAYAKTDKGPEQSSQDNEIAEIGESGGPPGWHDLNIEGFDMRTPVAGCIAGIYRQFIFPGWNFCIDRLMIVSRLHPILIISHQPVPVLQILWLTEFESRESEIEGVLFIGQHE